MSMGPHLVDYGDSGLCDPSRRAHRHPAGEPPGVKAQ